MKESLVMKKGRERREKTMGIEEEYICRNDEQTPNETGLEIGQIFI